MKQKVLWEWIRFWKVLGFPCGHLVNWPPFNRNCSSGSAVAGLGSLPLSVCYGEVHHQRKSLEIMHASSKVIVYCSLHNSNM